MPTQMCLSDNGASVRHTAFSVCRHVESDANIGQTSYHRHANTLRRTGDPIVRFAGSSNLMQHCYSDAEDIPNTQEETTR